MSFRYILNEKPVRSRTQFADKALFHEYCLKLSPIKFDVFFMASFVTHVQWQDNKAQGETIRIEGTYEGYKNFKTPAPTSIFETVSRKAEKAFFIHFGPSDNLKQGGQTIITRKTPF